MKKELGIIGLGKMGAGLARNLMEHGWHVVGWNRTAEVTQSLVPDGLVAAETVAELVSKLPTPRVVWLMLPAGVATEQMIFGAGGLSELLQSGDTIIEGGNSYWEDDVPRAEKLKAKGIRYLDAGVSGGPAGARNGACVMVGGDPSAFAELEELFRDMARPDGYQHFPGVGAGHFVKMVHNGIEYGMMQAIAEGMEVLKVAPFNLNLKDVARIYQNGSVIESRLVGWLQSGYEAYGTELEKISDVVAHSGEGEWTVKTARGLNVEVPIIEASYQFRVQSKDHPRYANRVLSALRNQFGGHAVDGGAGAVPRA